MTRIRMLINSVVSLAVISFLILTMFGCGPSAVVVNRNESQQIIIKLNVNSEPSGAKVFCNDVFQGNTPITLTFNTALYRSWQEVQGRPGYFNMYYRSDGTPGQDISLASMNFSIKVHKEGYKLVTRDYSSIPSLSDIPFNPDPSVTATVTYNFTAFLERASGPDIDLDLKLKIREPK